MGCRYGAKTKLDHKIKFEGIKLIILKPEELLCGSRVLHGQTKIDSE